MTGKKGWGAGRHGRGAGRREAASLILLHVKAHLYPSRNPGRRQSGQSVQSPPESARNVLSTGQENILCSCASVRLVLMSHLALGAWRLRGWGSSMQGPGDPASLSCKGRPQAHLSGSLKEPSFSVSPTPSPHNPFHF